MPHKTTMQTLWKTKLKHAFNHVVVGRLFRCWKPLSSSSSNLMLQDMRSNPGGDVLLQLSCMLDDYRADCIVVGCEDGIIRLYDIPSGHGPDLELDELEPRLCLETKAGPVQSLVLADITRFSTADLIVGDARGTMTIFCNGQILSRQSLSEHSLNCLQVDTDATGNASVISGDSGGVVDALLPYSHLWKLRLDSMSQQQAANRPSSVKCLLATTLASSSGQTSNYILASDECRNLHFIKQGLIVLTLQAHVIITAMCCGNFLPKEELQSSEMHNGAASQVALGGNDGSIFIMSDFQIHKIEYANIQLPIMHLAAIATGHADELDSLLCAGHSNCVTLYHNKKLLNQYEASDWINSLTVADLDKNGEQDVLIGCRDGGLHALKVS